MPQKINYWFLIVFTLCLFDFSCYSQENDLQYGLANIAIGSVVGGVGAIINKRPEEKLGKTLLKGLAQGGFGGYLVFESKRLLREFSRTRNYNLIWPSKIVNAAGSSIIENAAANRDLWARWHLNLGFNRFEVDTKDNFKLRYRIMPLSLSSTIYMFSQAKFDVDRSMVFGTFVFEAQKPIQGYGFEAVGAAGQQTIILKRISQGGHRVEAHELVHVYQNESFLGINMFFNRPLESLKQSNKYFRLYDKIFYTDFHSVVKQWIYNLELNTNGYKAVSFEREASYFSN
ncbi:hypothetical protein [Gillisia limnaea]|uniref:Secreted protein n=1 Tax=Gillisia limnaea (strain DSM 15749 / LMG 21470 / R-8282) TaxID=865937 RepID=H2BUK9_GILLR|nr:hypothetical protein [Gillisia limnaea]EHQ03887.1 secreted protein [Gillisia limnaea DSM 15749]